MSLRVAMLLGRADATLTAAASADLARHGHEVAQLASGEELLARGSLDCVVTDADLCGQWTGLGLVEALRGLGSTASVVLVGERPAFPTCRRAMQLGAHDFLERPVEAAELARAVEAAARRPGEPAPVAPADPLDREALERVSSVFDPEPSALASSRS